MPCPTILEDESMMPSEPYPRTIKLEDRIPRKKITRKISGESDHVASCEQVFIRVILRKEKVGEEGISAAVKYILCRLENYFRPTYTSFGIKLNAMLRIISRLSKKKYDQAVDLIGEFSGLDKQYIKKFL